MIYLIDDKRERQIDYGWTAPKFDSYKGHIRTIHTYDEILDDNLSQEIFKDNSILIFHESFFDAQENLTHGRDIIEIRNKINQTLERLTGFKVVYFSGSKSTRQLESSNVAHLPVSVMYQNLEVFIQKYIEEATDLRYLLFGRNYKIEEVLLEKLNKANNSIEDLEYTSSNQNLIIKTEENAIENPIQNGKYKSLYLENDGAIDDSSLDRVGISLFDDRKYDNLFIPLCFGSVLSDYNGLSLATHIRCSGTKNQLTNIFIYSFLDDNSILWKSKYFDILKTKNIHLINYSKKSFQNADQKENEILTQSHLPYEMKKLNLKIPKNYNDSHELANEFAIHCWSSLINVSDDVIEKIENKVNKDLYFKWLKTIRPFENADLLTESELRLNYEGDPKILFIDDEVDKGWGEILSYFFGDINSIFFDYLVEDFKSISQNKLVERVLDKIRKEDFDVVLLDFRLIPADFKNNAEHSISGIRILEAIKDYNPGIQVILFSATNKIWNLIDLQEKGLNGFIQKESPFDFGKSTRESIQGLVAIMEEAIESLFVKDFYKKIEEITKLLLPRKNYKKAANPLDSDFVDEVINWLGLSCSQLRGGMGQDNRIASFLFLFSAFENLANQIIVSNGKRNKQTGMFRFEFRKHSRNLIAFDYDENTTTYSKTAHILETKKNAIPWAQKILNTLDDLSFQSTIDINNIVSKRNYLIHPNSALHGKINITKQDLIDLFNLLYKGLKSI